MKRTFLKFLPIAAAVLLATSCSKDNDGDNSVVSNPAPVETQNIASPTESKAIPFSIKVTGGGSLSKVAYNDNGSTVKITFDATTDANREMTVSGDGKSTTLTLSSVDANGVATFDGEWTDGEPGEGKDITATITIAATGGETSSYTTGTETLEDLMEKCGHTYTGTFHYKTDNSVTLYDDKAYIEIIMSPLQHDIDLRFNGSNQTTNYAMTDGKVWIAVAKGTTFITNFTAEKTCSNVKITTIDRSGFVDLGIPGILWADHNIGGTNPEDYGDYYAWGETTTKPEYDWSNYKYGIAQNSLTKYCSQADFGTNGFADELSVLGKHTIEGEDPVDDDVAHARNEKWSMPTFEEFEALKSSCYSVWTEDYNGSNTAGYIVYKDKGSDKGQVVTQSGTANSNYSLYDTHIFIPCGGYKQSDALQLGDMQCCYWSSNLVTYYPSYAFCLVFHKYTGFRDNGGIERCYGLNVRAVRRM